MSSSLYLVVGRRNTTGESSCKSTRAGWYRLPKAAWMMGEGRRTGSTTSKCRVSRSPARRNAVSGSATVVSGGSGVCGGDRSELSDVSDVSPSEVSDRGGLTLADTSADFCDGHREGAEGEGCCWTGCSRVVTTHSPSLFR